MDLTVAHINFHHLRYFWAVAKVGNLTRTAAQLRVAQSALSSQIHQLEEQLGEALFLRQGRSLTLTEAGRITLAYAEEIFSAGGELLSTLKQGRRPEQVLRIGAVATLSRNFQESFIRPLLEQPDVRLCLEAGGLEGLLVRLEEHALDVVVEPASGARTWAKAALPAHRSTTSQHRGPEAPRGLPVPRRAPRRTDGSAWPRERHPL